MISSNTITPTCLYKEYNKKKQMDQYCKFPICINKNQLSYCLNHLPLNEIGSNGKMIKCPQCFQVIGENILKKHLTKCNSTKKPKEISNEDIETPRKWYQKQAKVNDIPQDLIKVLNQKINKLHEIIKPQITKREIIPNDLYSLYSKSELEGKNSKNILQEASLIGNMLKENILHPNGLYIELGCGAGEFSKTIQLFCNNTSNHLLVDRMKYTARHRYDHLIQAKKGNNYFDRLIIDIQDLNLNDYNKFDNIIGCSKHLCGCACDLSLELLSNKVKKEKDVSIAIATCCHYLLNANTFINTQFFIEREFTEEEFNALARLSSWSTLKDENDNFCFGKKIKELIDFARLEYLKQNGFKGTLVEYTTQTKENHLLLAYRKSNDK